MRLRYFRPHGLPQRGFGYTPIRFALLKLSHALERADYQVDTMVAARAQALAGSFEVVAPMLGVFVPTRKELPDP